MSWTRCVSGLNWEGLGTQEPGLEMGQDPQEHWLVLSVTLLTLAYGRWKTPTTGIAPANLEHRPRPDPTHLNWDGPSA